MAESRANEPQGADETIEFEQTTTYEAGIEFRGFGMEMPMLEGLSDDALARFAPVLARRLAGEAEVGALYTMALMAVAFEAEQMRLEITTTERVLLAEMAICYASLTHMETCVSCREAEGGKVLETFTTMGRVYTVMMRALAKEEPLRWMQTLRLVGHVGVALEMMMDLIGMDAACGPSPMTPQA